MRTSEDDQLTVVMPRVSQVKWKALKTNYYSLFQERPTVTDSFIPSLSMSVFAFALWLMAFASVFPAEDSHTFKGRVTDDGCRYVGTHHFLEHTLRSFQIPNKN